MFSNGIEKIWNTGRVLKDSFQEYQSCLKELYLKMGKILKTPQDTPEEFRVEMAEITEEFFALRKNIFSCLFQSVYQLLGINKQRRILYAKLNHLFRIWVTSADNLLDNEDKIVVPIKICGKSFIMRQVISIMLADRLLKNLLDEALAKEIISDEDSKVLSEKSLEVLLPSAAEEAVEEGGITHRPHPDYLLYTIHRLKTGLLFHLPFLGPENIEENINMDILKKCKDGLGKFGLGCQLLDDIKDIEKDKLEKRHNYVLSKVYWKKELLFSGQAIDETVALARQLLEEGLLLLDECGLCIGEYFAKEMALSMFKILGVEELIQC